MTFSLSNTGNLLWNNDAFFNGGALFCVLPSGVILAVFRQGTQPSGCVFIDLTIVELNSCPAGTGSANGTANLLQGIQGPTGL